MAEVDVFRQFFNTKGDNVLLEFDGALSQDLLVRIGDVIVKKVAAGKLIKTIFAIFVELAQNIMHYSAEKEKIKGKNIGIGIILFSEDNKYYNISSGNKIDNSKIKRLEEHLNRINSLDEQELKCFYKERLRAVKDSESKGAGLGLIDIARKSKNKIEYQIFPIDEDNSFIKINVKIKKEA
jgi:hypothetical protein